MLKKLFSHTLLYSLGPQIPKLANILVLPIITLYLTPLDYGVYGTILAYSGLLIGIKTFGFDFLLVNSFYKKENRWTLYWKRYLGILFIWQQFYSIFYAFILYFLIPEEADEHRILLILLIVLPNYLFSIISTLGFRYHQIAQKPQRIFITTALGGTVTVIVNYYCFVILKTGYLGWYYSGAVGSAIMFIMYIGPIIGKLKIYPIFKLKIKFIKEALKLSLPTLPHNYSSYLLNSSDRLVMDQFNVNITDIGKYNMAYVIGNYFDLFGDAVGMAVGPYYTKLFTKGDVESEHSIKEITYFLQITFISLSFFVSLWFREIFHFLIKNNELNNVYPIAIIIVMGYAYRPMYWASVNKLFFLEKTKQLWKISFLGGVINVVLNLIFINIYGYKA
jgi:O-antigen/teichoic acid export membrane protein